MSFLSARPHLQAVSLPPFGSRDVRSNLPAPLTSLIGREREIATLSDFLRNPAVRLVTLTGVGGVGKTRLALQVASDLAVEGHFADGVVFVDLATIRDPDLVTPVIAQTLGVSGAGQEPTVSAVKNFLVKRHLLLILDNFEQVSGAGPVVVDLLHSCPALNVIVTSRSLLNLTGEQAMPVPPLSLDVEARDLSGEDDCPIPASDAARLFEERTRAVNPGFDLSAANWPVISEIVKRLDGLPLAIELAAARGALLSPSALLARLDHTLPQLTGGPRDQPARHQAMRTAIAWSYELLNPVEQRVFRCLGVFAGGCTLEAAERICGQVDSSAGDEEHAAELAVEPILEMLARHSLVRAAVPTDDGATRLMMLETIREFAAEELEARGEHAPGRRHAEYYQALAAHAEPTYWGDAPGDWRAAIDLEIGNLQVAVDWAMTHDDTNLALRLASARFDPFWTRGANAYLHRRWADHALTMRGGGPIERVRALTTAAWLAHVQDDFEAARSLAGEALALARAHEDEFGAVSVSFVVGATAFHEGKLVEARRHLDDALAGFRRLHAPGRVAWTLSYLSSLDSRGALDEGGDPAVLGRAASLCEEALAIFRDIGHDHGVTRTLHGLAYIAWKQRDLPRALALSREVLALDWEQHWPVYHHLEDIADIAGRTGQAEVAARLYGAADRLRELAGRPVEPVHRDEFERDVAVARQALGDDAFAEAWAAGRALSPEQAVAEAEAFASAGIASASPPRSSAWVARAGLTPRELDVLHQLVDGRTDREIAEHLFISRRTASKHVEAILAKLAVPSRGAAAAEARRQGLAPTPTPGQDH